MLSVMRTFLVKTRAQEGKGLGHRGGSLYKSLLSNPSPHFWLTLLLNGCVYRECLKFCFMGVIQAELDRVAQHWNLHRIRPQNNVESPPGRPDTLFFLPELQGDLYIAIFH